jgi:uncharacterized protein
LQTLQEAEQKVRTTKTGLVLKKFDS